MKETKMIQFIGGPFDGAKQELEIDIDNPYIVFQYREVYVLYHFQDGNMVYQGTKNKIQLLKCKI